MNMTAIERIAKNTDKQWYLNQKEVARILGCHRSYAAAFLAEQSVPYYRLGRAKKYFLPEVMEAAAKLKWKDTRLNAKF